jgi:hypothetical protein
MSNKIVPVVKHHAMKTILVGLPISFQPRLTGFDATSGHVGFVVDSVPLGQVFSKYIRSPANPHILIILLSRF